MTKKIIFWRIVFWALALAWIILTAHLEVFEDGSFIWFDFGGCFPWGLCTD